jgi:hypothetical protein
VRTAAFVHFVIIVVLDGIGLLPGIHRLTSSLLLGTALGSLTLLVISLAAVLRGIRCSGCGGGRSRSRRGRLVLYSLATRGAKY